MQVRNEMQVRNGAFDLKALNARGFRRLVFVGWSMPGERERWAADAHAFDDAGGPRKTTR
jgi:hypothetical protein